MRRLKKEVRRKKSEGRSQKEEVRREKSEGRSQKGEVRRKKSEGRSQKGECVANIRRISPKMTAKEKQISIVKLYLKPTMKNFSYLTERQMWWKDKGDFFIVIDLQNYSWNAKNKVDFCFNISIVLKTAANYNEHKKPSGYNPTVCLRENYFLPDKRKQHKFRSKIGYALNEDVESDEFTAHLKIDFEDHILPALNKLNSLQNCVDEFGDLTFWGDNLKRIIAENNLLP